MNSSTSCVININDKHLKRTRVNVISIEMLFTFCYFFLSAQSSIVNSNLIILCSWVFLWKALSVRGRRSVLIVKKRLSLPHWWNENLTRWIKLNQVIWIAKQRLLTLHLLFCNLKSCEVGNFHFMSCTNNKISVSQHPSSGKSSVTLK